MTTPIQIRNVHTQAASGTYAGYFAATIEVDKTYEAPWIEPLLENIAANLSALEGPDWKERVSILIRAMNPQDALLLSQSEIPANGQHFVTDLFRQVPMLTKDQVIENARTHNIDIDLSRLMRVTIADITLYIADQFAEDGSLQPEVAELMNIFRRQPDFKEWDIATWWINPTGWLSGDRPRDVYKDNLEGVKFAAEQEILHLEH